MISGSDTNEIPVLRQRHLVIRANARRQSNKKIRIRVGVIIFSP
jgi:hypothetical protein